MTTPLVEECLDAEQVSVGTPNGPGIWVAPAMTAPPATTHDDFDDPWRCLGYLSDDGPTVGQSTDSEDLTPWQSVAPIKTIITARAVTLQFVLWQLNEVTLALYFDTDVPEAGADGELDMEIRTDQAGHTYAMAIDARDGNRVLRFSFLRASLSDAGDMAISRGTVIPLDCTLSALETGGRLARVQLGRAEPGEAFAASANGTGRNGVRAEEVSPSAAARRAGGGGARPGRAVPDAPQA